MQDGGGAGLVAVALGVVGFVALVSLAVFFAIGGPFGSINDWSIGVMGVLTALLVLALDRERGPLTAVAVLGAAVVVVGAGLVISRTTGFFLAGLVESLGFAFVGLWLVVRAGSLASLAGVAGSGGLGLAAGAAMALGFIVAPAIVSRLDGMAAAPPWVYVGMVGWLGIFVLFPAWCLVVGMALRRG